MDLAVLAFASVLIYANDVAKRTPQSDGRANAGTAD